MTGQAILIDPTKSSSRNLAYLKAGAPIVIDISTPAGQKKNLVPLLLVIYQKSMY